MIYHLALKADWERAAQSGEYMPPAFATDGFIHCSPDEKTLLEAANKFYKSVAGDFLVLDIDEPKVKARVVWEGPIDPNAPRPAADTETAERPPEVIAEFGPDAGDAQPSPAPTEAALAPAGPLFPHIYGALNRDAVAKVRKADRRSDGTFWNLSELPPTLPANPLKLKTATQLANELLAATDDFSEALEQYKDQVKSRINELDEDIRKAE